GLAWWLLFGLAAVLVAQAVVDSVSPAAAMLGAAAGNLAFALPVNGIAGLGPAQAAWVLATTWAGVPRHDAVVSALALHAVVLSNSLLLGGLAFARGSSLRQHPPAYSGGAVAWRSSALSLSLSSPPRGSGPRRRRHGRHASAGGEKFLRQSKRFRRR